MHGITVWNRSAFFEFLGQVNVTAFPVQDGTIKEWMAGKGSRERLQRQTHVGQYPQMTQFVAGWRRVRIVLVGVETRREAGDPDAVTEALLQSPGHGRCVDHRTGCLAQEMSFQSLLGTTLPSRDVAQPERPGVSVVQDVRNPVPSGQDVPYQGTGERGDEGNDGVGRSHRHGAEKVHGPLHLLIGEQHVLHGVFGTYPKRSR
jgi:hypothetical protein